MIVVGDVSTFALECQISKNNIEEGRVFIVLNGSKYGSNNGDFNLTSFFRNIKYPIEKFNPYFPELFDLDCDDVLNSIDAVFEDEMLQKCPIGRVVKGFFDDPSDVLNTIVFYGGDYAFDDLNLVMISNGKQVKIMVKDLKRKITSESIIATDYFKNAFITLEGKYNKLANI